MKATLLSLWCCLALAFVARAQEALQSDLCLQYLVQKPAKTTAQTPVLILLHGYGSNEADLFGLVAGLPADFLIVSVRAPYEAGPNAYQWLDPSGSSDEADMKSSREMIRAFIPQLLRKYKADSKQVYLSGFSQGGMMSYAVGLCHPELLAGIAPLGGRLFDFVKPEIKVNAALKKLRIFIGHGDADTRVAYKYATQAESYLKSLGLKPELHSYPGLQHSISREEITDLYKWLKK